jgi:hypothetical protein
MTTPAAPLLSRPLRIVALGLLLPLGLGLSAATLPAQAKRITGCQLTQSLRDLNGDQRDDAVVGDPYATVDGQAEAGTVTILFGDLSGIGDSPQRLTLTQADLGETPEAGDHFGWSTSLAPTGQLDRCAGLAIGSPGEDVGGHADAGLGHLVHLELSSETVPTGVAAINVDQGQAGGTVETGDAFGTTTAVSEATDDGSHTVAFGAPGEDIGTVADAGAVNLLRIGDQLRPLGELRQGRALPGGSKISDTPQAGDRFGAALVSARLDLGTAANRTDRQSTLLIGAPGDTVSGHDGAGSVTVVREKLDGARRYTQNTAGVAGTAENGDRFGESIAVSLRLGNIKRRVAIGSPGEDLGSTVDAGSVTVLIEEAHTLRHLISGSQATPRVAGTAEPGDHFGQTVAFFGSIDLGIGVPDEDVGTVVDAGAVQYVEVLGYLDPNWNLPPVIVSLELVPTITEDTPGTPGSVQAGSRFGSSLAGLIGQEEQSLAISSPFQDGGSVFVFDLVHENNRAWKPGTGGIGGVGVRFGQSVS